MGKSNKNADSMLRGIYYDFVRIVGAKLPHAGKFPQVVPVSRPTCSVTNWPRLSSALGEEMPGLVCRRCTRSQSEASDRSPSSTDLKTTHVAKCERHRRTATRCHRGGFVSLGLCASGGSPSGAIRNSAA